MNRRLLKVQNAVTSGDCKVAFKPAVQQDCHGSVMNGVVSFIRPHGVIAIVPAPGESEPRTTLGDADPAVKDTEYHIGSKFVRSMRNRGCGSNRSDHYCRNWDRVKPVPHRSLPATFHRHNPATIQHGSLGKSGTTGTSYYRRVRTARATCQSISSGLQLDLATVTTFSMRGTV
jgi:hypothetical protein